METIIKKAIDGGMPPKGSTEIEQLNAVLVLDPLFWQSLGKACGWNGEGFTYIQNRRVKWLHVAGRFHRINLTEGWAKAVDYLTSVTK